MSKEIKDNNQHKDKAKKQKKFKVKSWYANRYQFILVQRNILLIFALFSTISVSFGMVFLNHVMSSKSLEPYVIEVEEKTGVPTVVNQKSVEEFTGNELMKKYFINQFVQLAAGYNPKTYPEDAEKVRVLSNSNVFNSFRALIKPIELGTETRISVRIKSIIFSSDTVAQIRILRTTAQTGLTSQSSDKDEVINLEFQFNPNIKLNLEERLLNPLGFQVKSFFIAEEIVSTS